MFDSTLTPDTSPQRASVSSAIRWAWHFAWQSVTAGRQRAILAMIGITIGIAAVVALLSIGKSVERQALKEFETIGTQVVSAAIESSLNAEATGPNKSTTIKLDQWRHLVSTQPAVAKWSDVTSLSCNPNSTAHQALDIQLTVVRPQLLDVLGLKMAAGRFLAAVDQQQKWMVLGQQAYQRLVTQGQNANPGEWVSLCGQRLQIVGILAPSAEANGTLIPFRLDSAALISPSAAARIDPQARIDYLMMKLHEHESPIRFAQQWKQQVLDETGQDIVVTTAQKIIELKQRQAQTYTRFLLGLGSISLLVGALGILNIMLIAVVERRREIGIRLALGAQETDIALQFLMESILLGAAGGVLGLVIGLLLSAVVCWAIKLPWALSLVSLPLALLMSIVIGALAGMIPARQAARLDPIETLQGT